MNTERAQEIIADIVTSYRASAYKGGRQQYPASQKYLKQAEELGIRDMIPNGYGMKTPGNTEIQLILNAATDSGKEVGGMVDGEGDVTTTAPHPLYVAINEQPEPTPETVAVDATTSDTVTVDGHDVTIRIQLHTDDYDVYIQDVDDTAGDADPFGDACELEIRKLSGELDPDREYNPATVTLDRATLAAAMLQWLEWYEDYNATTEEQAAQAALEAAVNAVVTTEEAAQILGVNRDTVRVQIGRGLYSSARKSGTAWLLARAEVEARRDAALPREAAHEHD